MNDLISDIRTFLNKKNKVEFTPQDFYDELKSTGKSNQEIINFLTGKAYMASLTLKQQQFLIQTLHIAISNND